MRIKKNFTEAQRVIRITLLEAGFGLRDMATALGVKSPSASVLGTARFVLTPERANTIADALCLSPAQRAQLIAVSRNKTDNAEGAMNEWMRAFSALSEAERAAVLDKAAARKSAPAMNGSHAHSAA